MRPAITFLNIQLSNSRVSVRREQSTSVQSGVTFREVWHLFLPWQG